MRDVIRCPHNTPATAKGNVRKPVIETYRSVHAASITNAPVSITRGLERLDWRLRFSLASPSGSMCRT